MKEAIQQIKALIVDEEGATAIEYGLLAALLAATILGSVSALSVALQAMYTTAMGLITTALGS